MTLKEILYELRVIRKELQAIRSSVESNSKITIDSRRIAEIIYQDVCYSLNFGIWKWNYPRMERIIAKRRKVKESGELLRRKY